VFLSSRPFASEQPWWKKIDWEEATDDELARWSKRQQKIERGLYVSDNE
jgi:anaerobic selenocysteine-containing dehydrogenase